MNFIWGEYLGDPACPWGRRWVLDLKFVAFRLHQWFKLGDQEMKHDHAWGFITFVLKGGYTDISERDGQEVRDELHRYSVRYRAANHKHYVKTHTGGGLTFVISGPVVRDYFFWRGDEKVNPNEYLASHGSQPCE